MDYGYVVALKRSEEDQTKIIILTLITTREENRASVRVTFRNKSWRRIGVRDIFKPEEWFNVGDIDNQKSGVVCVCKTEDAEKTIKFLEVKGIPEKRFFGLSEILNF